jgi:hypothetical protein
MNKNHILISSRARPYIRGKKDPVLHAHIKQTLAQHPHLTLNSIADKTHASRTQVRNIKLQQSQQQQEQQQEEKQQQHNNNKKKQKNIRAHTIGSEGDFFLQTICNSETPLTLPQLQQTLTQCTNQTFTKQTIRDHLRELGIVHQVAIRVDPRKLTSENINYYLHYLHWMSQLTPDQVIHLCFFDECRVDKTGIFCSYCAKKRSFVLQPCVGDNIFIFYFLNDKIDAGAVVVWGHRGCRPTTPAYKRSFVTETFNVTVLISLSLQPPVRFTMQKEAGNSFTFVEFIRGCLEDFPQGLTVIGDNCSFHCKGEFCQFNIYQRYSKKKKSKQSMNPIQAKQTLRKRERPL